MMSAKGKMGDRLQSTVIISGRFAERRTQSASPSTGETAAEPLEPGSMIGRYLTLSRVGVGGMGVVYRAHDTELNRTVALKVLPPHLCKFHDYLQRFRTEAKAQARLNSPYVITLFEIMEHPAGEILVLEYVEGETLENRLRRHGPLAVSEAVKIFEQTLCGVEYIHQMGVVHRDLKPSNIFITRHGEIKLMDFGIARLLDNQDPSQKGTMVGTLLYMSPEQINGRETDSRSDIYTLGISLFEAVTGRLPFERRSDYALMHAHVLENPPSPKEFQRRLPPELEQVILKAIEKEPNRRYQSAKEFRANLMKLGLVERRHSHVVDATSDMLHSWRQRSDTTGRRIWGGKWLDLSLVATAILLAVAFEFYPLPKSPTEFTIAETGRMQKTIRHQSAIAESARAQKTIRHKSTVVASNRKAPIQSPQKPQITQQAVKPSKDKYASLRQAWGG